MKKKILIGIILFSLLASLVVGFGRHQLEQTSKKVEITLDWISFDYFQKKVKEPKKDLLQDFKKAGLTSVGLFEKNIHFYSRDNNNMIIIDGEDIAEKFFLSNQMDPLIKPLYNGPEDKDNIFTVFKDNKTYKKLYNKIKKLPGHLIGGTNVDSERGLYLIKVENGDTGLTKIPLAFSEEELELVSNAGLHIVPRISNNEKRVPLLPDILDQLKEEGRVSNIIFNGSEVIGYEDKLDRTAQIIDRHNMTVGMIEPFIAKQKGIKRLASLMDMEIVRVHSILQGEVDKYSYEKVLDRYLLAVKERNVRVLYHKLFTKPKKGVEPIELNIRFLEDLTEKLEESGYQVDIAEPFSERTGIFWNGERTGILAIILIGLGVFAAGLLLLDSFIKIPDLISYGLLAIAVLFTLALSLKGYVILTRTLLALATGIILPSLAVITGYQMILNDKGDEEVIIPAILVFLKTTGITLIGALFIVGLLSDIRYMYQINLFRGIKLTFLIPLLLVAAYYLKEYLSAKSSGDHLKMLKNIMESLNQPVRYSHLVVLGILGIAGLVYIGRTGNIPMIPVPDIEMKIRALLEDIFVYRPRFKEFVIGHPLIILTFYYLSTQKKHLREDLLKFNLPLLVLGTIGQVTVINTFSHIHTPVMVSVLRVFYGIVLGTILGIVLIYIFRFITNLWSKLRSWVYG